MSWDQELPLSTDGGALQVTRLVGDADVIRWIQRNPLKISLAKGFGVKLRALLLFEAHTGTWTGLVWTQLVLFRGAHTE